MKFDITAARNDGYSDDEIADFLSTQRGFDLQTALADGHSSSDIADYLSSLDTAQQQLPEGVTPSTAGAGRGSVNPEPVTPRDDRGIIERVADYLKPEKKSVLEDYAPTPDERKAELDRRLSYGAGPISSQTAAQADLVRSGMAKSDSPTVSKVAKAMEEQGAPSFGDLIERAKSPISERGARDAKAEEFRTPGEWAVDTISNLSQGAVGLVQLPVNIIAPSSEIAQTLRDTQRDLQAAESDVLRANREQMKDRVLSEDGFFDRYVATVKELVTNPTLTISEAAKQLPNFLGVVGAARLAGAASGGAVSLAGRASPTLALGEAISGGTIQTAARAAGTTAGGVGASMVMAGGDAAGNVYETLTDRNQTPLSLWKQNPDFQKLVADGKSESQAIEEIATTKARMAALITAPLGLLGYAGAEAAIATKGLGKATAEALTARGMAKTAAKDLVGEQVEEGGTQFGGNVVAQTVNQNQSLTEGVPEAMGTALVTSSPFTVAGIRSQYKEAMQGNQDQTIAGRVGDMIIGQEQQDPRLVNPADTIRGADQIGPSAPVQTHTPVNFTEPDSDSAKAGLTPIVVPLPEPTALPTMVSDVQVDATPELPAATTIPGPTASATLPSTFGRATDQDLLSRTEAAVAAKENNNADIQPTQQWFGRKGDGYATEQDAAQALPGRQRMFNGLDWKVEQMPNGKYRLAGYSTETTLGSQTTQAVQAEAQGQQTPAAAGATAVDAVQVQPATTAAPELPSVQYPQLTLAKSAPISVIKLVRNELKRDDNIDLEVVSNDELGGQHQIASVVANMLGKTYTVVRNATTNGSKMPNGFINRLGGNHIFAAEDATDAPLFVAVHEAYHGLPEAERKALNTQLLGLFRMENKDKFLSEFGYKEEHFDEEAPAFMAQAISKRADFWEELRTKMGDHDFVSVAKIILDKLTTIIKRADSSYGQEFVDTYIADIKRARSLLSDAYAAALKNNGAQLAAPAGNVMASNQSGIGAALKQRVESDFDGSVQEYAQLKGTKGGRVIDTDIARELSPEYRANRNRAAEVHEAASAFTQRMFEQRMATPGKGEIVAFMAGGGGSGKSSAEKLLAPVLDRASVVMDGTLSGYDKARRNVQLALDSGRRVAITYVYRDPEEAIRNGVLTRAMRGGRTVPIDALVKGHAGSSNVVRKLQEEFGSNPNFDLTVVDNSQGKDKATISSIENITPVKIDGLKERLINATEDEYKAGRINEGVYRATVGSNASATDRSEVSDRVEQVQGRPEVDAQAGRGPEQARDTVTVDGEKYPEEISSGGIRFSLQKIEDVADAEAITMQDLVGYTVFPILADLTAAGYVYMGKELRGGPYYTLLPSNIAHGLIWANDGKGVSRIKREKASRGVIGLVIAMKQDSHATNNTVANIVFRAVEDAIQNGDVNAKDIPKLDELVRNLSTRTATKKKKNKDGTEVKVVVNIFPKFAEFPGFSDRAKSEKFLREMPFEARGLFFEEMTKPTVEDLGLGVIRKVINDTIEPDMRGLNMGDAVMAIEFDPTAEPLILGESTGTPEHDSYKYAVKGRVIGKFKRPVSFQHIFRDLMEERHAKAEPNAARDYRSLTLRKPEQLITQEIADRVPGDEYKTFISPAEAKAAAASEGGDWTLIDRPAAAGLKEFLRTAKIYGEAGAKIWTVDEAKALIKKQELKIVRLAETENWFAIEERGSMRVMTHIMVAQPGVRRETLFADMVYQAKANGATHIEIDGSLSEISDQGKRRPIEPIFNELASMTDAELTNLGISPKEIRRISEGLKSGDAVQASPTSTIMFSKAKQSASDKIKWREITEVKQEIGLDKLPAHIIPFAKFMGDMATKATNGGLTSRDVIKAYTIARSSMNRSAVSTGKVRLAGLKLPSNFSDAKIRPEGAFGYWLLSPIGQQYLNAAEVAIVDAEAIADAVKVMAPFGTQNALGKDLERAAGGDLHVRLTGMTAAIVKASKGEDAVADWQDATDNLFGVREAKKGFLGSLLGFGQLPTFDARQINVNVDKGSKEDTLRALSSKSARNVVAQLSARMDALGLTMDPKYRPFYQHLTHHAVWDAVGGTETTHEDVIESMVMASRRKQDTADQHASNLAEDLAAQEKFLQSKAEDAGYKNIDEFVDQDYNGFVKAAEEWRKENPAELMYSRRTKEDPKKTVTAYKLFRVEADRPGELFPLFVPVWGESGPKEYGNRDPRRHGEGLPIGEWYDAEVGETAPATKTGKPQVKSKLGGLAFRPGWHAGDLPIATHIGAKSDAALKAPDLRAPNQVWAEVELPDDVDWQAEANKRGVNKLGKLIAREAHITDQIPEDGFYRYKTNSNMTGNWLIGGSMKVNRILSDEEVIAINDAAGTADLPRATPFDAEKYGFDGQVMRSNKRQKLSGLFFKMETSDKVDKARIRLQDDALRMKRVIEAVEQAKGEKIPENRNFYDANTLMPGRIQAAVDNFKNEVINPLLKRSVELGVDLDELAMYAYAKHAKERNAYIASINPRLKDGGSGMTNDEADNILQMVALAGDKEKFEDLHSMLMSVTSATRTIMMSEGLISEEEFNSMNDAYENYIPLRGFENVDEDTGVSRPGVGRGINVRGKETIRALGRRTKAGDLIENVIRDYERVISRVEKNDVAKVLLDFVLSNPDEALWNVDLEKSTPTYNKAQGVVQFTKGIEKGEDTIGVKVGGKQVYIQFADKELVRALRQAWKDETSGLERATLVMTGWWNNWMRAVLTKYNPAFAAINIPRDALWSGAFSALDELGVKGTKAYFANYGKALMAAARHEAGKSGTQSKIFGNPEMDKLYEEFRASGGITGGFFMRSLDDINADLRSELLLAGAAPHSAFEKIKSLPPYKLAKLTLRSLEFLGAASENATRFALYMTSRDMGKSHTKAAVLAKDGTTNFNRKGEWGGSLNNLYLFFNAGVQGNAQLLKVLKNKKVQASMAGVTGVSMMLALYGAAAGGEDDDGEAYWDKIPGYVKERNLVIMLPPGDALAGGLKRAGKHGRYFTIPVQYGFNMFPNMGYVMADMLRNAQDSRRGMTPTKAALHMSSVIFGSANPFGGSIDPTDGVQVLLAVAPTLLDLPIQVINERNTFGSPSAPSKSPYDKRPDSERMFISQQGTVAARIAKALNELGGGNEAKTGKIAGVETAMTPGTIDTLIRTSTGGLGGFVEQVATSVMSMAEGDPVKAGKIPFLNRFYGEVDEAANIRSAAERMAEIRKLSDEVKAQQKVGIDPNLSSDEERLMSLASMQSTYAKQQTALRKAELAIINDKTMSEAQKKLERQRLQVERDRIASAVNKAYLSVTK